MRSSPDFRRHSQSSAVPFISPRQKDFAPFSIRISHYKKDQRFDRMQKRLFDITGKKITAFHRQYRYDRRPFQIESPPQMEFSNESQLHAIGFYKRSRGVDAVRVEVRKSDHPIVLVLNGHDSMEWVVQASPDAKLEAVIVGGNESQKVDLAGADNIPILNRTRAEASRSANDSVRFFA